VANFTLLCATQKLKCSQLNEKFEKWNGVLAMILKWIGHSCFQLTSELGTRIVMDPFNSMIGKMPEVAADAVTASHGHGDHNFFEGVSGNPIHLTEPGEHLIRDISIKGIPTFHDDKLGEKRGKNIVFCFEADGTKICHCGDLGHVLTDDQLQAIGDVDVLLLPTGGTFTIDSKTAAVVANQVKPKVVVPMHYSRKKMSLTGLVLEGVDQFIKAYDMPHAEHEVLEIKNPGQLLEFSGVVVLKSTLR